MMLQDRTLNALGNAPSAAPPLDRVGAELCAAPAGPARLALARRFFARIVEEAPRFLAVVLSDILASDATGVAKARMAAAALRAAPRDQTIALATLQRLHRIHPMGRATEAEAAALTALIAAANDTGRGELTRTLGLTLRGRMEAVGGGAPALVLRDARLDAMTTSIGLWRAGRLLSMLGDTAAAAAACDLIRARYPYRRAELDPARTEGRALVLNLGPLVEAETLGEVYNHANLTRRYPGLDRDRPLAIDVLFVQDLDFGAVKDQIEPPHVIVNNIRDGEVLAASGVAPAIEKIAAYFDAPLINPPANVRGLHRARAAELAAASDRLVYPETIYLDRSLPLDAARRRVSDAFSGPAVIDDPVGAPDAPRRSARTADQIEAALAAFGVGDARTPAKGDIRVQAFHNFKGKDGLHRKYRAFLIDGAFVGAHELVSVDWRVSRANRSRMVDDDIVALLPEATKDALGGALAALSLDVAGVDFALLDDGRALIFGFGAAMPVDAEESQVMDRIATLLETRAFGHRAGDGGES